jgi:hypothetical protein
MVMLAFNAAMIAVALWLVGAAGRRTRRAVEAPTKSVAELRDESGHGEEPGLEHGADHAPAAVGAH